MTDFYQKYLKYKIKYLELKEQNGGCNTGDFTCEWTTNGKKKHKCYNLSKQFCGENGPEYKINEGKKCKTNEKYNTCIPGLECKKKGFNSYTCQKINYQK
jgi:hypothetical protein